MSPSLHTVLAVASAVLGVASLVIWYLLHRWTVRGTDAGLQASDVSSACHRVLMAAWVAAIIVNGILQFENLVVTIFRLGVSVTFIVTLVVWAAAERHRRSRQLAAEEC